MQRLSQVAQQARFAAMQPGQITRHFCQQSADLLAFELAQSLAVLARACRETKARGDCIVRTRGQLEAKARRAERQVREIALQSEMILERRALDEQADHTMMTILRGVAS